MNTQTVKNESLLNPSFIDFPDGRRISYHLTGGKLPGVVFLGGFNSDMYGSKAIAIEAHCKNLGQRFLRFNYTGHGQSSGQFTDGSIGAWKQDALDMIERLAPGANILVGSSMGGWIMLLVALARPDDVKGLVGIASAPDFTEELLWDIANDVQKKQLVEEGVFLAPSCYDNQAPYPITYKLITEGRNHLLLACEIPIICPVRLIHGTLDEDVPYQVSERLLKALSSTDVTLTLVKNAGHRLSQPHQLEMICSMVDKLIP